MAAPPPVSEAALNEQLTELRQRLEEEKKQEVLLENKLNTLRSPGQVSNRGDADQIEEQNKQLSLRLEDLQDQKRVLQARLPDASRAIANQQKYAELKKRKEQLEADINAYAYRMDQLKETSLLKTMPWPVEKKRLIHVMVQKDARNNQLREKIKMLREDVEILRDQVAKFERRVNFMQGQNKTP
jgi:chromosome segregation ATPase